ncbi:MAG: glycerophosphodiester phosphodiesterase [Armatimonadetes bacterium]|nr:glycerophosphodiester phosphodiesterase [Armatimonadota bacterium]
MIVVGHRGCALLEPENTLRGFRRALALGCDYVETDVRLTRDGHLILMHDEMVDRTTNGSGRMADLSFAEIRALDAGQGERIPTLAELLEVIRGRAQLLCELKGERTADEAVRIVREAGMERDVVFTCFHLPRIRRVKEIDPRLRTGAIFGAPPPDFAQQAKAAGAEGCGVNYRHQRPEVIAAAHHEALLIRAWNPDTEPEIQAMIDLGVDGIGSNRPDLVLRLLGRLQE